MTTLRTINPEAAEWQAIDETPAKLEETFDNRPIQTVGGDGEETWCVLSGIHILKVYALWHIEVYGSLHFHFVNL